MKKFHITIETAEDVIPLFEGMELEEWRRWLKLPADERRRLRPPPPPPLDQRKLWD